MAKTAASKTLAEADKLIAAARALRKKKTDTNVTKAADENGGFQGEASAAPAAPEGDPANWGGVQVPPELADAAQESMDQEPNMGLQIPPELVDVMASITEPDLIAEDAAFDLVPFVPEDAKTVADVLAANTKWVVFANTQPVAEVRLADQDHKERVASHFASQNFGKEVIEAIKRDGFTKTMADVKARYYAAVLDETKRAKEIKAKLEANAEEALRQRVAGIQQQYEANLDLAITASINNIGQIENPLKDAFQKQFEDLGVDEVEAAQKVDDAFTNDAAPTIASILAQARTWTHTHPEAMETIRAMVESTGVRQRPLRSQMTPAQKNPNFDAKRAQALAANAIPVTTPATAPAKTPVSEQVGYRERFGRVGRRSRSS